MVADKRPHEFGCWLSAYAASMFEGIIKTRPAATFSIHRGGVHCAFNKKKSLHVHSGDGGAAHVSCGSPAEQAEQSS